MKGVERKRGRARGEEAEIKESRGRELARRDVRKREVSGGRKKRGR